MFQKYEDPECLPVYTVGQLNVSPPSPHCSHPIVSKLIANCHNELAYLKRTVAQSLRGDLRCNETLTYAEMKEALRISLIVAAEEAFPNEINALRQGK